MPLPPSSDPTLSSHALLPLHEATSTWKPSHSALVLGSSPTSGLHSSRREGDHTLTK